MKLKPCPSCGAVAIRDDKMTKGVEGIARCTECSFCAAISDWQAERDYEHVDFPILKIVEKHLRAGAKIAWQDEAWYLFDVDGEDLAFGETIAKMLNDLIFREC